MLQTLKYLPLLLSLWLCLPYAAVAADTELPLSEYEALEGFVDLFWDEGSGRLLMRIEEFDEAFIYQTSLPRGVGSNDIGLDRGQLGATKLVRFIRSGPKVLLVEDNLCLLYTSPSPRDRS